MNYDAYFTDPFLKQFPDNLFESVLSVESSFNDLWRALQRGDLLASADGNTLLNIIEKLKSTEPELAKVLAKVLEGLETAGKIKAVKGIEEMPACFEHIIMPKKKLKQIACAFAQPAATVYHDELNEANKHQAFMKAGKKPMFLNAQLKTGEIQFLYEVKQTVLNIGDPFQWSSVLPPCKFPLAEIRILDPYLYKWINDIDLESMLKPLVKCSGTKVSISVISDVNAISKLKPEEVKEKVHKAILALNIQEVNFTLYSQKRRRGNIFHKRVLWTNLWALQSDTSLNFIKTSKDGNSKVRYENTLTYIGRYTGMQSTWYDIYSRWDVYLKESVKIER
jgi:hypothetical protein